MKIKGHVGRAIDDLANEVFLRLKRELEEAAANDGDRSLWETLGEIEKEWRGFNAAESSQSSVQSQERGSDAAAVLETLTADQRDALFLHLGRGMPCAEIARQTGVPRTAVLNDLLRAYSRLRLLLGDEDLGTVYRQ